MNACPVMRRASVDWTSRETRCEYAWPLIRTPVEAIPEDVWARPSSGVMRALLKAY
jgi:hypothetical protein